MHEILRRLPRESYVLDLGCATGSFDENATQAKCVRLDRDAPVQRHSGALIVQADAAKLPSRSAVFQAIISSHSLEHFDDLEGALREMGRVIGPRACSLYIA